jgi:c-di-GMP-related signal transduction protein
MEIWYSNTRWKRFLPLEGLVQAFSKVRLDAHRLKDKDAHSDQTLLARLIALINSVVKNKNYKIVSTIGVDYEGAKAFVALKGFPEQHDHFRRPGQ